MMLRGGEEALSQDPMVPSSSGLLTQSSGIGSLDVESMLIPPPVPEHAPLPYSTAQNAPPLLPIRHSIATPPMPKQSVFDRFPNNVRMGPLFVVSLFV